MMPGARRERMRPIGARHAAGWSRDDRRAFIVRRVGAGTIADVALTRLPGALEIGAVAAGIVARQECGVARDPRRDELVGDVAEDRAALRIVGGEQCISAPALQPCGELPAEIDRILEPVVEPEAAVGRMAVRGVSGDEGAPGAVA